MIRINRIEELGRLCYLLNGRKHGSGADGYNCGFFPKKVTTRAHGKPGQPAIDIDFNGIEFGYSWICCTFEGKNIYIDRDTLSEFVTDDSKKNAKAIFGKNAQASIIVTETKWALTEILTEYRDQMNSVLMGKVG